MRCPFVCGRLLGYADYRRQLLGLFCSPNLMGRSHCCTGVDDRWDYVMHSRVKIVSEQYDGGCEMCGSKPSSIGVRMQWGPKPVLFFCSDDCRLEYFGVS